MASLKENTPFTNCQEDVEMASSSQMSLIMLIWHFLGVQQTTSPQDADMASPGCESSSNGADMAPLSEVLASSFLFAGVLVWYTPAANHFGVANADMALSITPKKS